ncbi:MAG: phosphoenolpyruvate--protein phosphotransferase [Cellvibrionaceae bacterium]
MLHDLRAIVQEVNSAPSLDVALNVIVQRVKTVLGCEVCSVYLKEDLEYVLTATEGLKPEAVGSIRLTESEGLVGLVASREEPLNLEKAEDHPRYRYFPESGEERFSSFLGAPIIHQRRPMGVIVVQQREQRRFDEGHEAFLMTISAQLAGVLAHAKATGSLRRDAEKGNEILFGQFVGVAGASGIGLGEVLVLRPQANLQTVSRRPCDDIDEEIIHFANGLAAARSDVERVGKMLSGKLEKQEQALFDAYLSLLDDDALASGVIDLIREGQNAEAAWSEVILSHINQFNAMEDPYLRERASDLRDLGRRVLGHLQQDGSHCPVFPENTILVAEDLVASMLGEVPPERLKGIVSTMGSVNSHVAIVARALGLPAVVGAVDIPLQDIDGMQMVVDGYTGTVSVNPDAELLEHYRSVQQEDEDLMEELVLIKDLPSITPDDHRLTLWVNTGLMSETVHSLKHGAEGVGLYRTEVPFLMRDRFPTEEEQRQVYREQLEAFHPYPVTMRMLDIGGDKALPYFPIEEENPFLGWRGIRVTLDHPELYLIQARAMFKASSGLNNLRVMLPMITSMEEVDMALALGTRAYREVQEEGYILKAPKVGAMIEVPAAVYLAKELARRLDFLSVGSNDLTQYLLAVDRNNPRVANLYHTYHPSVLRALQQIVEDAHSENCPVSICGEFAGDPGAALLLMAMRYDVLSMSGSNLLKVKAAIRGFSLGDAKQLLDDAMKMPDARSVQRLVVDTLKDVGLGNLVSRALRS